jgi:hypothetical protein
MADIVQLFRPYIHGPEDVIGQDDLNSLLSAHPEVEKNSVRLWLASAAVLSRVIQTAEITQSAFEFARIRANLILRSRCLLRARRRFSSVGTSW